MNRFAGTLIFLLLLISISACSKTPEAAREIANAPASTPTAQRITSESVVKVAAQPVEVSVGGSAEAVVKVTIQSGYHVNANPPTFPYLKPTQLEISSAEGVSSGPVSYPPALNKKLAFADKPLAIYEGETELKTTLKAEKTAETGARSLSAKLRVQACDDQVCYQPGAIDFTIPVNIK
jgi:DsbC/DsbD-like thiol-disulfide interchange protein